MLKKIVRYGGITALGLSLLVATTYKEIVHNIMSHHPTEMTTNEIIRNLPKILFTRGWYDGIPNNANCIDELTDMNAIYLKKQENPFPVSEHRPTSASIPKDTKVYDPLCLIDFDFNLESVSNASLNILNKINEMKKGEIIPLKEEGNQCHRYYWNYGEGLIKMKLGEPIEGFGNFTLSLGYDEKGKYLSFFDIFDFKVGKGGYYSADSIKERIGGIILSNLGEPLYFYKRWYFKDVGISDDSIKELIKQRIKTH